MDGTSALRRIGRPPPVGYAYGTHRPPASAWSGMAVDTTRLPTNMAAMGAHRHVRATLRDRWHLPRGVAGTSGQAGPQGGYPVHRGVERGRVELPAAQGAGQRGGGGFALADIAGRAQDQ